MTHGPPPSLQLRMGHHHLSWTATAFTSVDHYNVYRDIVPDFVPGSGNLVASVPAPATSYQDGGLSPETHYYYAVTAVGPVSNGALQSDALAADATTPQGG